MTLTIVLWIATLFLYYTVYQPPFLLWVGRTNVASAVLIPFATFIFISYFNNKSFRIPSWISIGVYTLTLFFFFLSFTPFIDANEIAHGAERTVVFGPLYEAYLGEIALVSLLSVGIAFLKWKKAAGIIRLQLAYFMLGFISLVVIAIFFNALLPYLFHDYSLQSLGSLASIGFVGFTSYAMVRYRFLDISRLLASAFIDSATFILLGVIYFIAAYGLGYFFFPQFLNTNYIIAAVVLSLIIRFALRPTGKYFRAIGTSIFSRHLYSRQDVLADLQEITAKTLDLDKLILGVLSLLVTKMQLTSMMYIGVFEGAESITLQYPKRKNVTVIAPEIIQYLTTKNTLLYIDEIEDTHVRMFLRSKGFEVFLPLQTSQTHNRFLLCGQKKSLAPYYKYDIDTLREIAQSFLNAIQNARYIYDIQLFNKTLKQEVTKATRELRRVNTQLRKADTFKNEFISIASHELKTPTTAIQGFLWLVLKKDKELSPYSREKIERVAKLTEHMTYLVNDMLDVSKIESKRITLFPEKLSLAPLITQIIGEFDLLAINRHINVRFDSTTDVTIWADKGRVRQIISNILSNAIKYTQEYGKIYIKIKQKNEFIEIAIKDTGVGIKKEDMSKLFTKFGKLESSANAQIPGTGLGLYITKHLVELSGGEITAQSTAGKGSTFTITLPSKEMV